ncbi:hypothetical protein QQP08_025988 [Theobroma cacao]|nr:hypothetical protein QQP08_025988 [Theobroma cacao]
MGLVSINKKIDNVIINIFQKKKKVITRHQIGAFPAKPLLSYRRNQLGVTVSEGHPPQNSMELVYAMPSPLAVLRSPTAQPHLSHHSNPATITVFAFVSRVSPISGPCRLHHQRPRVGLLCHHEVHQNILAITHLIDHPPHLTHRGPTLATVLEQILRLHHHELGQHYGVLVRVHRVNPLLPCHVYIMRSHEYSNQTLRVPPPHPEGEFHRFGIHFHVVIAHQNGPCPDRGPRKESGVQAARGLGHEGDGGAARGGD